MRLQLHSWQIAAQDSMQRIVASRDTTAILIDIAAPILVFPKQPVGATTSMVVIDLGHLHLATRVRKEAVAHSYWLAQSHGDRFDLELSELQLFCANGVVRDFDELRQRSVEGMDASFVIEKARPPLAAGTVQWKVSGSIPSVHLRLTDSSYQTLNDMIEGDLALTSPAADGGVSASPMPNGLRIEPLVMPSPAPEVAAGGRQSSAQSIASMRSSVLADSQLFYDVLDEQLSEVDSDDEYFETEEPLGLDASILGFGGQFSASMIPAAAEAGFVHSQSMLFAEQFDHGFVDCSLLADASGTVLLQLECSALHLLLCHSADHTGTPGECREFLSITTRQMHFQQIQYGLITHSQITVGALEATDLLQPTGSRFRRLMSSESADRPAGAEARRLVSIRQERIMRESPSFAGVDSAWDIAFNELQVNWNHRTIAALSAFVRGRTESPAKQDEHGPSELVPEFSRCSRALLIQCAHLI